MPDAKYPPDLLPEELLYLLVTHVRTNGYEHVREAVELALRMAYLRGGMDTLRRLDEATRPPGAAR